MRGVLHDFPEGLSARRIISLSPSITEIVFALERGDRLVGATSFCTHPPAAARIPRVGGYLDPNYEAIATLAPDLVIVLSVHDHAASVVASFGITTLTVNHTSVPGIIDSIDTIGRACGAVDAARVLARHLRERLDRIARLARELPRPRVMLCVERPLGSLKEVCIVGNDGFYDALLTMAGGHNVYDALVPLFPSLSAEGIMKLDPEVIIEFRVGAHTHGEDDAAVLSDWATLPGLRAVRTHRVHILRDAFMVIPGPRLADIAECLLVTIHPECAERRP